jgi:heavy metal efflux system protein
LSRHPSMQNIALEVNRTSLKTRNPYRIDPLEIRYKRGRLYSPGTDQELEIWQNIGSPWQHIAGARLEEARYREAWAHLLYQRKAITSEVKQLYFGWVHKHEMLLLSEARQKITIHYLDSLSSTDTINIIDPDRDYHLAFLVQARENAKDDYEIAEIELRLMTVMEIPLATPSGELELYEIMGSSLPFQRFSDSLVTGLQNLNYIVKDLEVKFEKASLTPRLGFGYFERQIGNMSGMRGWQAGIEVPLESLMGATRIREAEINRQKAYNEVKYSSSATYLEVEKLLFELNKTFKQVQFYKEHALPRADILLETRIQEADQWHRLTSAIEETFKIRREYLDLVLQYNLIAARLEFFVL